MERRCHGQDGNVAGAVKKASITINYSILQLLECITIYVQSRWLMSNFYARQLYRQVLLRARISYGNLVRLSVRPSVCLSVTTRYGFKPRWDRDSGSSPYDSLESLVSYEVIWCHWVKRFPSNEGTPLEIVILPLLAHLAWKRLLIDTDNKHCWRAFQWYQHRWPWTTLNPQNMVLKWFFCYFRLRRTLRVNFRWNILEIDQDNLRTKLNWCCRTSHEH